MHKKFVVLIVAAMFLSGCMGSGTGSTDQPPYTASGQILSGGNQISLSDVKLVVEPGGKVVDVDSSGTFTIHGLKGTVSIVPNLEGWKFDPESRTIKGARSNLTFTASKDEGETSGLVVLAPTIYGGREGAEGLESVLQRGFRKYSFGFSYERRDKGIFVHLVGDALSEEECRDIFGVELTELDEETTAEGVVYRRTTLFDQPCLLISAMDMDHLRDSYTSNSGLREELEWIIAAESQVPIQTRDLVWMSNGYQSKVYRGLFKNPDYTDLEALLQEDGLTRRTSQVEEVAGIINDKQDLSTLKEIYGLLSSFTTSMDLGYTFELTASRLLSNGALRGCTTYATAFSTLCRAKGIPCVVVDTAHIEWIHGGCSLNYVHGHYFVEVYIDDEWYLVDSTAGILYQNYDRNNWLLPDGYIAFTKSLSFIDPGTSEENHNLLQRVAFVNKRVDYEAPVYPTVDLYDHEARSRMKASYDNLGLEIDNAPYLPDHLEIIEADPGYIDFSNIGALSLPEHVEVIRADSSYIDFSRVWD